jgi:copper chaperone CopZ
MIFLRTTDKEDSAMILEISLRVNGLDRAKEGSNNALENLGKSLEGLYGVVAAHCNLENQRITVRYDPNSVTILRILNRIESAGRQRGLICRATDIHKGQQSSSASGGLQISSGPIPAVEAAHLSAL